MSDHSTLFRVTNPWTGKVESEYPLATDEQVDGVLARATDAFAVWRRTAIEDRCRVLRDAADLFEKRSADLGEIITREMGKLTSSASAEASFSGSILRYYANEGERLLADQRLVPDSGGHALLQRKPIGPLLGIMPWNYPYYQVTRFAAPNLLLGNTIVLKHAPSCPESALAIEQLLIDAGLPDGAYVNVFASNDQTAAIVSDRRIQGISLTGSERAGAAVAEIAGRNLKKVVLELGGSDAWIVRSDADVASAAQAIFESRLANIGQACNSPKRIIVLEHAFDDLVGTLVGLAARIQVGDPSDPETRFAPMASAEAATALRAQVLDAVGKGAKVHFGDPQSILGNAGYGPIILSGLTQDMRAYGEELFGPVFTVYRVRDDVDAVRLANDTDYGLGATIFSRDVEAAEALGEHLDVGMVYINRAPDSEADLPFGGVKKSGFGRELGALGLDEFANRKLVWGSSDSS